MWCTVLTHTHTCTASGHCDATYSAAAVYRELAAWARRAGIDAVGMGSPYTPRTALNYARFDGAERDRYYDPSFDKQALLASDEISLMLREVNEAAKGKTLFYLDNETPKARFGHLWWVGHRRDMPEWHDYDQPFDRWMIHQALPGDGGDEPMPYERRPYLQILSIQRASGALGYWAHPTSWWFGDRGQFITNLATEMPAHAIAEGGVDGMAVTGYHPYRPQYLALWHELLDRGYKVAAVAEEDCGLSEAKTLEKDSPLLTHVYHDDDAPLTMRAVCEGFRSGRMFASNGPFIELTVDGIPMGQALRTGAEIEHRVQITVRPAPDAQSVARVELVGAGGQVLWQREQFAGGVLKLSIPGLTRRGYLVARVFGDRAECNWREVKSFAVSNPVYLHPPGTGFEKPATTDLRLRVQEGSPVAGAEIRFESMSGALLSSTLARAGEMRLQMPASGRVTVVGSDSKCQTHYLLNTNPKLLAAQRYLYRGRFLKDFPSLTPGECPPQSWRIDDYISAMREVEIVF